MAIDLNKLREKHEKEQAESGGGAQYLKLKDGEVTVRILPTKDGDSFFMHSEQHAVQVNGQWSYLHCRQLISERCPLCEAGQDLWRKSNAWDDAHGKVEKAERNKNPIAEAARKLNPSSKYYMNVVVRPTNEVKILTAPKTLYELIMNAFLHPDLGDLSDMDNGYDFVIVRGKDAKNFTSYEKSYPRIKPSKAGSAQECAAFLEGRHNLESAVKIGTFEEMDKLAKTILANFATQVSETPTPNANPTGPDANYLDKLQS